MLPKNVVRLSGDEVTSPIYCSAQPCLVSCQARAYLLQVCHLRGDWQDTQASWANLVRTLG